MISYCGYNQEYSLVLNSVKLAARSLLHRAAAKLLLGKNFMFINDVGTIVLMINYTRYQTIF